MYRPDAIHFGEFHESEANPPVTALYLATYHGLCEVVTLLLDSGQDVDQTGGYYSAPLLVACYKRNVDVARMLLDRGANIEVKSPAKRQGALHLISNDDFIEIVRFLLDHGASVDIEDSDRDTPLILAADRGQCEIIKALLDHGANIERFGWSGYTALMRAVQYFRYSAVNLLLDRGANIDQIGEQHGIASGLHCCIYYGSYYGSDYGYMPMATLLLDRGANVDLSNSEGLTPLVMATQRQELEMLSLFLDRGADVFARDNKGRTVLKIARRQRRRMEKKDYPWVVQRCDQMILRVKEAEKAWQQEHGVVIDKKVAPDSDTEALDTEYYELGSGSRLPGRFVTWGSDSYFR